MDPHTFEKERTEPLNDAGWYVGDGGSDLPVFSLMNEHGGIAIGVVEAGSIEQWGGYEDMFKGREVQNLAPADYRDDSELMHRSCYPSKAYASSSRYAA